MSARWYDDVAPASQTFACSGAQHEIVWDRGRLGLVSHGSIDAERALRVFGARAPDCLAVVDHWMEGLRRPAFLEHWAKLDRPEGRRMQWYGQVWRDSVIRDEDRLAPLAQLSDPMLDRLAFGAVRRVLRRGQSSRSVEEATVARVRRAFVHALVSAGVPGGVAPLVRIDCTLDDSARLSGIARPARGSHLEVRVPKSWLLDVHARGLDVVAGCAVLAAEPLDGAYRVTVATFTPSPGGFEAAASEAIARRDRAGWTLLPG